ncbi:hypothetical protein DCAR_0518725 [Daucus carota subsp. sativus]|uniref:Uncharacterized protein n=1 Tax=Daucus carota subsp. sativus TaxID=79200 RepID=A0A164XFU7_DAUCS|nr:hypothetical protein DCAR_0518725 [Daucus carota subsp. sativus]
MAALSIHPGQPRQIFRNTSNFQAFPDLSQQKRAKQKQTAKWRPDPTHTGHAVRLVRPDARTEMAIRVLVHMVF